MSAILPLFFLVLASLMLFGGLYATWNSFRAAFGASDIPDLQGTIEAMSRQQLLEQKRTLLQTLQDLRFDRDAGKISDKDFEILDSSLRTRTKEVLRLLDADVEPFRRKAEKMIKERLGTEKQPPYRKTAKPLVERLECPKCDTNNDLDAVFCKKCGHSFEQDEPEEEVDETEKAEELAEEEMPKATTRAKGEEE